MTFASFSASLERMVRDTNELLKRALELPPAERLRLARELVESVDDTPEGELEELAALDPEFVAELRRRAERVRSGKAGPGIPAEKALAEIERQLKKRRRAK